MIIKRRRHTGDDEELPNSKPTRPTPYGGTTEENVDAANEGAAANDTGGEPLFTHWVHGKYMVGSETKYPAWTHWVHVDYFLITFTICPPKYPPGTC